MKRGHEINMISHIVTSILLWLLIAQASQAVRGVTDACCNLAIRENAYIGFPSVPSPDYVCGQSYSPGEPPAPSLKVNLTWCKANCDGYALYTLSETGDWAVPLVSFILPAVIFSTQIPRRLGLKPLPRYRGKKKMIVAVLFLIFDMLIIVLDTTGWIFAIMIGAGPSILSGLVELWLDYKVTCRATNGQADRTLTPDERIEAFTAVLAGNLLIEGVHFDPQDELREAFLKHCTREEAVNGLLSMLESQMAFGGAVGAAILLYLGSYVYTLSTLGTTQGDQAAARALAFGICWMTIVHVSVIGGSLLASNNPSTAAAIVKRRREWRGLDNRTKDAGRHSHLEDFTQAMIEIYSYIPLIYETRYEPIWMWSRGKNKGLWLFIIAYLLILVPCGLAFLIEYREAPVTVGCRSMTILLYTVAQTVFIIFSAWSHFKAFRDYRKEGWCGWLRRKSIGISFAIFPFAPAWLLAVFTTFAGTLMQITGIFENCSCAATYTWTDRSDSTVSLATDTRYDRASSGKWNYAGYIALAVLGAVTFSG